MAVVILATVVLSPARPLARGVAAGLALFAGVTMLATGSRGPLLAVVLVFVLLALRSDRGGRALRLTLTAGLLAAGWLFLSTDQSAGSQRIQDSITGEASGTATRQPLWDAAVRYLGDPSHSVGGTGWGGFVQVMRAGELLPTGLTQYPHNVFLEVFVEGGWITGGAITVFILLSTLRLWRLAKESACLPLLALGAFSLVNASVSGDINDNRLLWVTLALSWTIPLLRDRSKGEITRANRLSAPVLQNT
jgi:O-antigen ligase